MLALVATMLLTFTTAQAGDGTKANPYTVAELNAQKDFLENLPVTEMLEDEGLIEYPWMFKLYCMASNAEDKISAGTYELNAVFDYHALVDGMMTDGPKEWEERDGQLWYNSGTEGELFGEATDPWVRGTDENGFFTFATIRFVKV